MRNLLTKDVLLEMNVTYVQVHFVATVSFCQFFCLNSRSCKFLYVIDFTISLHRGNYYKNGLSNKNREGRVRLTG